MKPYLATSSAVITFFSPYQSVAVVLLSSLVNHLPISPQQGPADDYNLNTLNQNMKILRHHHEKATELAASSSPDLKTAKIDLYVSRSAL